MAGIAISLLWLLIGAIILAGVICLVLYGVKTFITPIPPRLEQGIWFIFLLLLIIYAITAFVSGRFRIHSTSRPTPPGSRISPDPVAQLPHLKHSQP
jgi:hypothetical protein